MATVEDDDAALVDMRVSAVAVQIYRRMHVGERAPELEPVAGSVHDAWRAARLSRRQLLAWRQLLGDLRAAAGHSRGLTARYAPRLDGSPGHRVLLRHANAAQERIENLMNFRLHEHERRLLSDMLQEALSGRRIVSLEQVGLALSGYRNAVQARSAGTACVQRVLDSVAEFYGL